MDRREFTKLSAFALAWNYLPMRAFAGATTKPVGYAVVGLGTISDIFMRACANSQSANITALVTGHPDTKGAKYSAMYGIPKTSIYTYETFDRIRENPDIDAIYVGLPNSMHCEYTVRGAQAGKHVLCEKPIRLTARHSQAHVGRDGKWQFNLYDPDGNSSGIDGVPARRETVLFTVSPA